MNVFKADIRPTKINYTLVENQKNLEKETN